jgi:hypothetical protein
MTEYQAIKAFRSACLERERSLPKRRAAETGRLWAERFRNWRKNTVNGRALVVETYGQSQYGRGEKS